MLKHFLAVLAVCLPVFAQAAIDPALLQPLAGDDPDARVDAVARIAATGSEDARIVLQLVSVAVLARLLTPHDYGLLAIVLVLVGLGEIFRDFGLTSASIQAPSLSTGS